MELFFFWIGCAVVSGMVASSKGRSGFGWFILGCFFGVFALIAIALTPAVNAVYGNALPAPDTHVKCPDCREFVFKDARKCKHCGTPLIPTYG